MSRPNVEPHYASYDQLSHLFSVTSEWLQEHGSLTFDEGREIKGLFNGLPLVGAFAPDYEFRISSRALVQYAPEACERLQLGHEPLRLNYFIPAYSYEEFDEPEISQGVDPDFLEPIVHFDLDKSAKSGLYDERLGLVRSVVLNGLIRTDRITRKVMPGSFNYAMLGYEERGNLDPGDLGSITLGEYEALLSVVQVLRTRQPDELRAGKQWVDKIHLM